MFRLKIVLLSFVLVTLLTISLNSFSRFLPYSWLSYSTRPLWDRDERPQQLIPRQDGDRCSDYGWDKRSDNVEIWDATIISTELELLLIRLAELNSTRVTKHFILESTHSFTGIPKPSLLIPAALESPEFAPYRHKIEYLAFEGHALAEGENPFVQENQLRIEMTLFLREHLDSNPYLNPLLLFSDVDEIVSAQTIDLITRCQIPALPMHLGLRDYLYSFEFDSSGIHQGSSSWRAHLTQWPQRGRGEQEYYRHGKVTEVVLPDSGWHCSWCFRTIDQFVVKAKGYSHTDRLGNRPSALLRPSRIQKTICEGSDIFAMLPEAYTWREMVSKWRLLKSAAEEVIERVPRLVRAEPEKFRWLLPGGCVRKS